jgi:hypothetical protein
LLSGYECSSVVSWTSYPSPPGYQPVSHSPCRPMLRTAGCTSQCPSPSLALTSLPAHDVHRYTVSRYFLQPLSPLPLVARIRPLHQAASTQVQHLLIALSNALPPSTSRFASGRLDRGPAGREVDMANTPQARVQGGATRGYSVILQRASGNKRLYVPRPGSRSHDTRGQGRGSRAGPDHHV